jgi:hypothetical protein
MKLKLHISFVLLLLVLEIMGKIPQVLASDYRLEWFQLRAEKNNNKDREESEDFEWWQEDDWDLSTIYSHLDCSTIFESERPIYSLEMWMTMRRTYHDLLGDNPGELSEEDGFSVAVEAKQSTDKGRSIYAAQDIQQGVHIWTEARQLATFDSGTIYKRFLASLPKDMACDVMIWSYIQFVEVVDVVELDVRKAPRICVDLEIGVLVNTVSSPEDTIDAGYWLPEWKDSHPSMVGAQNLYALRDIKKGEEILMDYDSGVMCDDVGWSWFGLSDNEYDEKMKRNGGNALIYDLRTTKGSNAEPYGIGTCSVGDTHS